MKKIITKEGKEVLVDDEDFEYLSEFDWGMAKDYPRTTIQNTSYYLHKMVMGVSSDSLVDHVDGNTLNNQKSNLRKCSKLENSRNRKLSKRNKSGYKGVTWYSRNEKWRASISVNNKVLWLGLFVNPVDAAIAYDLAAKRYYGEFAKTNKDLGLLD